MRIAMNLLSIEHLSKSYSRRQLFDDTSFFLQEGEKVGIIGINGTGKYYELWNAQAQYYTE